MAKFLVLATPRAGTAYTAELFSGLGLECPHEGRFGLETDVPGFLAAPDGTGESSWLAVPFVGQLPADVRVLHQTRHPLAVIKSLLQIQFVDLDAAGNPIREGLRRKFTRFALKHCPQLLEYTSHLERAAWFYYHWNRRIEATRPPGQILRYRLEDLDIGLLRRLLDFIGVDPARFSDEQLQERLSSVPTDTNTKTQEKVILTEEVTWATVPAAVREMAAAYGYSVETAPTAAVPPSQEVADLKTLVRQLQTLVHQTRHEWKQTRRRLAETRQQLQQARVDAGVARQALAAEQDRAWSALQEAANDRMLRERLAAELEAARTECRRLTEEQGRELEQARRTLEATTRELQQARQLQGRQLREVRLATAARARLERRAQSLEQQVEYLKAEVALRRQEVRYRLGDAFVSALRPGKDTVLLPARIVKLFFEGLSRRSARLTSTPARAPTSAPALPPPMPPSVVQARTLAGPAVAEVLGPAPDGEEQLPKPARPKRARRPLPANRRGLLFFCVNGAGLGHVTRSLAIARRVRRRDPTLPVYFLTSSQALQAITREGFVTYHVPPHSAYDGQLDTSAWNTMLCDQMRLIVDTHAPAALVYDGVFPYRGLLDAIDECGFSRTTMILRLRHKHDRLAEVIDKLKVFDELIYPGEAGAIGDPAALVPPELAPLRGRMVEPIVYLERDELLPRDEVRAAWAVPPDKKLVYVQLGAGNINDTQSWTQRVLDVLGRREDVAVVLAESPIAARACETQAKVHVLRHYPNSLFFNGFDLAVSAVGYNSFHEQLYFGLPSVLIPNQDTRTDDQVGRALAAHRALAAIAVLRPETLEESLTLALCEETAATMREKARELIPNNGAQTAAEMLLAAAQTPAVVEQAVATPVAGVESA
ncbi:MAG: glycosyltransferase [Planctomycetota bacterium]